MERVRIMGGKEASRGFLYQGFASVLEALTDKGNWDKIYVEFPTSNDKVDIALEQQNQIVKCIQVKSTINTFTKSDIKIWLDDLIKDIESPEYELFLIGQCDKSANTFIKSIEKYYGKVLDKEAKSSLNGFDTDLLDNKRIRFFILPFEIEVLEKIVRDSLHQYISDSNQMMTFDQIRFIASATVNDQMISSTHGKGIDRKDFDEEMEKRIFLVADKYSPKRISIGVKSFTRGAENLEKDTESCLSFMDNLLFQDKNQSYSVKFDTKAYEQMLYYCAISNPYETGGILIGNYSSNQAIANILQITPPPKNSRHSKCTFYRGIDGLKRILDLAWDQGQYYLGEWHYHPNASSAPSNIDKNQMIVLSQDQKLKCPEPILIIVGGYQDSWNINARLFVNKQEIILNKRWH